MRDKLTGICKVVRIDMVVGSLHGCTSIYNASYKQVQRGSLTGSCKLAVKFSILCVVA